MQFKYALAAAMLPLIVFCWFLGRHTNPDGKQKGKDHLTYLFEGFLVFFVGSLLGGLVYDVIRRFGFVVVSVGDIARELAEYAGLRDVFPAIPAPTSPFAFGSDHWAMVFSFIACSLTVAKARRGWKTRIKVRQLRSAFLEFSSNGRRFAGPVIAFRWRDNVVVVTPAYEQIADAWRELTGVLGSVSLMQPDASILEWQSREDFCLQNRPERSAEAKVDRVVARVGGTGPFHNEFELVSLCSEKDCFVGGCEIPQLKQAHTLTVTAQIRDAMRGVKGVEVLAVATNVPVVDLSSLRGLLVLHGAGEDDVDLVDPPSAEEQLKNVRAAVDGKDGRDATILADEPGLIVYVKPITLGSLSLNVAWWPEAVRAALDRLEAAS